MLGMMLWGSAQKAEGSGILAVMSCQYFMKGLAPIMLFMKSIPGIWGIWGIPDITLFQ